METSGSVALLSGSEVECVHRTEAQQRPPPDHQQQRQRRTSSSKQLMSSDKCVMGE